MDDTRRIIEVVQDSPRSVEVASSGPVLRDVQINTPDAQPMGVPGPKGDRGEDGATGATGPSGQNGGNGEAGATGPQGNDGSTGATGPAGANGSAGERGPVGWTAVLAVVSHGERRVFRVADFVVAAKAKEPKEPKPQEYIGWYLGSTGFVQAIEDATDVRGAQGERGQQGFAGGGGVGGGGAGGAGTPGRDGATGATGPQGAAGSQGSPGTPGSDGGLGATGATGPQGVAGDPGGATGATGPQGEPGNPGGATGPTGATGPRGNVMFTDAGVPDVGLGLDDDFYLDYETENVYHKEGGEWVFRTNIRGLDGATGPTGATGPQGTAGNDGAPGTQGATGPQGSAGASGATGPQGPQGSAGTNGTNGTNGTDGATGPQGPQGTQGATGPAGATGAGATGATGPLGDSGYSPVLAVVSDGERRVFEIVDWVGGTGTKPFDNTVGWNTEDASPSITVTNELRNAQSTAAGNHFIRANKVRATGKWYFEVSMVTVVGGNTGAGLANALADAATLAGGDAGEGFIQFRSGNVYYNGASQFTNGNMGAGGLLQVAYDADAHLAWVRFQSGNWNGSGTANPGTGAGGVDVSAIDEGGLFPVLIFGTANDSAIGAFAVGDLVNAPPSGFLAWGEGGVKRYIGETGYTTDVSQATSVRGAIGTPGTDGSPGGGGGGGGSGSGGAGGAPYAPFETLANSGGYWTSSALSTDDLLVSIEGVSSDARFELRMEISTDGSTWLPVGGDNGRILGALPTGIAGGNLEGYVNAGAPAYAVLEYTGLIAGRLHGEAGYVLLSGNASPGTATSERYPFNTPAAKITHVRFSVSAGTPSGTIRLLTRDVSSVENPFPFTATADETFDVPGGWAIEHIFFNEVEGFSVTGGVRIGTALGDDDVVVAQAIGANAIGHVKDVDMLKRIFNRSSPQTLYVEAVTAWNGATVDFVVVLREVF